MKRKEEMSSSQEDYLETILMLKRKKGTVRSTDVAEALGFSRPSVCNAMSLLAESGYLWLDEKKEIQLTPKGIRAAEKVYERHMFFKRQLLKAGVAEEQAGADACRMGHAISAESFEKLKESLEGHPEIWDGLHDAGAQG